MHSGGQAAGEWHAPTRRGSLCGQGREGGRRSAIEARTKGAGGWPPEARSNEERRSGVQARSAGGTRSLCRFRWGQGRRVRWHLHTQQQTHPLRPIRRMCPASFSAMESRKHPCRRAPPAFARTAHTAANAPLEADQPRVASLLQCDQGVDGVGTAVGAGHQKGVALVGEAGLDLRADGGRGAGGAGAWAGKAAGRTQSMGMASRCPATQKKPSKRATCSNTSVRCVQETSPTRDPTPNQTRTTPCSASATLRGAPPPLCRHTTKQRYQQTKVSPAPASLCFQSAPPPCPAGPRCTPSAHARGGR